MSSIQHQQLILRVPEELSERIYAILNTENGQMNIFITHIERHVDPYEFKLNDEVYPALTAVLFFSLSRSIYWEYWEFYMQNITSFAFTNEELSGWCDGLYLW